MYQDDRVQSSIIGSPPSSWHCRGWNVSPYDTSPQTHQGSQFYQINWKTNILYFLLSSDLFDKDLSPEFRDLFDMDDIKVDHEFRDLKSFEIIRRGPTPTLDWSDDKFLQYSMYNIKQLSNDEIKVTGVELIKDLKEHITWRTGYNILCLAFSIQSRIPGKKYAISDTGNFQDMQPLPQNARDRVVVSPSASFTAKWDFGDDDVAVKAYCYVAFSLLRLLTKSHVAYYRAQQHISPV